MILNPHWGNGVLTFFSILFVLFIGLFPKIAFLGDCRAWQCIILFLYSFCNYVLVLVLVLGLGAWTWRVWMFPTWPFVIKAWVCLSICGRIG